MKEILYDILWGPTTLDGMVIRVYFYLMFCMFCALIVHLFLRWYNSPRKRFERKYGKRWIKHRCL